MHMKVFSDMMGLKNERAVYVYVCIVVVSRSQLGKPSRWTRE